METVDKVTGEIVDVVPGMDALTTMRRIGGGRLLDRVQQALIDVGKQVRATGNDGKVTITLTVSKASKNNENDVAIVVNESVGVTLPKSQPLGAMFFMGDESLHMSDPRQTSMEFRVVEGGKSEVREVSIKKEIREA